MAASEVSLRGVPVTKVKLKSSREWEGRDGVACDEAEESPAGPAAAAAAAFMIGRAFMIVPRVLLRSS